MPRGLNPESDKIPEVPGSEEESKGWGLPKAPAGGDEGVVQPQDMAD